MIPQPTPSAASVSQHRLVNALIGALTLDSAYLFVANHASGPPRIALSAFLYEGTLILHLVLGLIVLLALARYARQLVRALSRVRGALRGAGAIGLIAGAVCTLSGIAFLAVGASALSTDARYPILRLHDTASSVVVACAALYLLLRLLRAPERSTERQRARRMLSLAAICSAAFGVLLVFTLYAPNTDRTVVNPQAPMSMYQEGDGPSGKFFPASAQSVGGQFFPSKYFMDSKTCGAPRCHPQIYREWYSSAHHLASFNNQWYRKSIEYMQDVIGTGPSKWCGGCHDMAVLLTQNPLEPAKSRFDTPIRDQDWPPTEFPQAHAGIGCAVCHSIVHVKSTMGQNDYLADYPPMHRYIIAANPFFRSAESFLTRLAPEPHKKTFLRPFHTQETAKFCSVCHKVHLDVPVNGYRWFRGFDEYDSWQASGVSGFGAASFYYPQDPATGRPAFKTCADCHMPLVRSHDAGNFGGFIHSHRFPAANTALPFAYHDGRQLAVTQQFLRNKALSIDIFALRRERSASRGPGRARSGTPAPPHRAQTREGPPVEASLVGSVSEATVPPGAAGSPLTSGQLIAPLNRGGPGAGLRPGETVLLDVVVRTLTLGHAFPGGTIDAQDVWVELEAQDSRGRTFFHSGKLQWPNGPVEEGAEQYRALLVDGHGNPINKRNAWAARAVVYAKVIPPGAADVVHYKLTIPRDCGDHVKLTAKLNYRKFTWGYTMFSYASRVGSNAPGAPVRVAAGYGKTRGPVTRGWDDRPMQYDADLSTVSGDIKSIPNLPITVLARDSITLPVSAARQAPNAPALARDVGRDRIRWNDYGIGLLLQGDFRGALGAFQHVTSLSPAWAEGYVNIGRVRQAERDTDAAIPAFLRALRLYDAHPTPMTPYQRARTEFFYAQSLFDEGNLAGSLAALRAVARVFPEDRNVRNRSGEILFRLGRYGEAVTEFQHTLSIDPEDVTAHYNLMKCFRAEGATVEAEVHEALYRRFKANELATDLSGMYRRAHPADNNLAQAIHVHGDAIVRPIPPWARRYYPAAENSGLARAPATRRARETSTALPRSRRRSSA